MATVHNYFFSLAQEISSTKGDSALRFIEKQMFWTKCDAWWSIYALKEIIFLLSIGKQIGNLLLTAEVIKDLEWDQTSSDISFKVRNFPSHKLSRSP